MDTDPTPDNLPLADRGWYLAIEFQHSTSAKFERAVALAGKLPGFTALIDESGTCIYRAICGPDELANVPKLLQIIAGWKNVRLYVCGQPVEPLAVDSWIGCYLHYLRHGNPPCRQPLQWAHPAARVGCRYAGISLQASDWDAWYSRGRLDGDGVFHVDKEYLAARVSAWEPQFTCCPYANAELLRRVVAALPDEIDPDAGKCWRLARDPYYYGRERVAPRSLAGYESFLRECLAAGGLFGGQEGR